MYYGERSTKYEGRNIVHTIKRINTTWIGNTFLRSNLLKYIIVKYRKDDKTRKKT
jgi:hypothetical protein